MTCWSYTGDRKKFIRKFIQDICIQSTFPTTHSEEDIITFTLVIIVEAEAQRAWRKLPKPSNCISCEALIWSQAFLTLLYQLSLYKIHSYIILDLISRLIKWFHSISTVKQERAKKNMYKIPMSFPFFNCKFYCKPLAIEFFCVFLPHLHFSFGYSVWPFGFIIKLLWFM